MEFKHNGHMFTLTDTNLTYTRNIRGHFVTIQISVEGDSVAKFVEKLNNLTKVDDDMFKLLARIGKD